MNITVGDTFDAMGETVEITNARGDEVCVHHVDREPVTGESHTVWRPRTSVAAVAARESWTRVDANVENDGTDTIGTWVETPRCPVCGAFMSRDHDGAGLPAASCTRVGCDGWMDDRELIDAGYVEA